MAAQAGVISTVHIQVAAAGTLGLGVRDSSWQGDSACACTRVACVVVVVWGWVMVCDGVGWGTSRGSAQCAPTKPHSHDGQLRL